MRHIPVHLISPTPGEQRRQFGQQSVPDVQHGQSERHAERAADLADEALQVVGVRVSDVLHHRRAELDPEVGVRRVDRGRAERCAVVKVDKLLRCQFVDRSEIVLIIA